MNLSRCFPRIQGPHISSPVLLPQGCLPASRPIQLELLHREMHLVFVVFETYIRNTQQLLCFWLSWAAAVLAMLAWIWHRTPLCSFAAFLPFAGHGSAAPFCTSAASLGQVTAPAPAPAPAAQRLPWVTLLLHKMVLTAPRGLCPVLSSASAAPAPCGEAAP